MREITYENCHVSKTESFISSLFPVSQTTIDIVYNELVAQGIYDEASKWWKGFPTGLNASKESQYYVPFTTTAEAIRKAGVDLVHAPTLQTTSAIGWFKLTRRQNPKMQMRRLSGLMLETCLVWSTPQSNGRESWVRKKTLGLRQRISVQVESMTGRGPFIFAVCKIEELVKQNPQA